MDTQQRGKATFCIARGLPGRRSVNMFSGHFGDIDLHQFGYGPDGAVSGLEQGIWDTAPKATYFDVPVLIPVPGTRGGNGDHPQRTGWPPPQRLGR